MQLKMVWIKIWTLTIMSCPPSPNKVNQEEEKLHNFSRISGSRIRLSLAGVTDSKATWMWQIEISKGLLWQVAIPRVRSAIGVQAMGRSKLDITTTFIYNNHRLVNVAVRVQKSIISKIIWPWSTHRTEEVDSAMSSAL